MSVNSYGKALLTIQRAALTVLTRGKKFDDMKYESSLVGNNNDTNVKSSKVKDNLNTI